MEHENSVLKKRWYVFSAFIVTALGIYTAYFFLSLNRDQEYKLYLQQQLKKYNSSVEATRYAYDTTAQTVFETTINTPKIQELMAKAAAGNHKQQEEVRQELYRELVGFYEILEKKDLRQLHFHLPQSISLLRFHRFQLYGDSLKGVRPTIDTVNQTHKEASGFEEGKTYNGFRHVFPIFHDQKFVGSVELSYSFDAIRTISEKLYPAHYELILKKDIIQGKVSKEEQRNYLPSFLNQDYFVDNQLEHRIDPYYGEELLSVIQDTIRPQAFELLPRNAPFALETEAEGKRYLVLFNPIKSFTHEKVGYIVTYIVDDYLKAVDKKFLYLFAAPLILIPLVVFLLTFGVYRLRRNEERLKQMAYYDSLTNIANRNSLHSEIQYMIAYAMRYPKSLSVIFFDIDNFKTINDTYGHKMGDKVLCELSQLIQERLRQSDIFGRWGGEEFLILLPSTELHDAIAMAENLREFVEGYSFPHGSMTCSFGVAQWMRDETQGEWINRADKMLYEAKENGRNQVQPKLT